jgi:hypothetical protein
MHLHALGTPGWAGSLVAAARSRAASGPRPAREGLDAAPERADALASAGGAA